MLVVKAKRRGAGLSASAGSAVGWWARVGSSSSNSNSGSSSSSSSGSKRLLFDICFAHEGLEVK